MGVKAREFVVENYDINILGVKLNKQFFSFFKSLNILKKITLCFKKMKALLEKKTVKKK